MKTIIHSALCPQRYLTAYGLDPARVIYFDIETTGFRASTSRLYMIGWAVQEDGTVSPENECSDWIVTQIMAESSAEEVMLLRKFRDVLSRYDTIIEFNGDRFDLPYMREKYETYGMSDPFADCVTVDLYREIKPYKNILGMPRLNQKSVEQFLHITREDPYNGGELIDVYRSVRDHTCSDPEGAERALFLHNYEDVLGMMDMTPLLAYRLAMQSTAPVSVRRIPVEERSSGSSGHQTVEEYSSDSAGYQTLEATFPLDVPVPSPLHIILGDIGNAGCGELPCAACEISVSEGIATVRLHLLLLCLYHFFPDYRNYYYLPAEDTAIHKSVASFVDASHREKAKAQNCYIRKQGMFLPQAQEQYQPVFKRFYKDQVQWFEYTPGMEDDCEAFSEYIHALVSQCAGKSR